MRYYEITYPNHTSFIVTSERPIAGVLARIADARGLAAPTGTIYNPKTFLTLNFITDPDKRQQRISRALETVLL